MNSLHQVAKVTGVVLIATTCVVAFATVLVVALEYLLLIFLGVLLSVFLGFGVIAGTAATIAKVLFFVFLLLFIIGLAMGRRGPAV